MSSVIVEGQFRGRWGFKVFSPGHINAKGQPDDFAVYCDTLAQARAVQAVRAHVAAKPSRQPSGKWNGPPTPWLTGLVRKNGSSP